MTKSNVKKPTKLKKFSNIISTIMLLVLVCAVLYIAVSFMLGSQPYLFGYKVYVVASQSMSPTFEKGDVLIGKQLKDYSQLQEDDIITFVAPQGFSNIDALIGQNVTHRIVQAPYQDSSGNWFVRTQGDNKTTNPNPDIVPIPMENIVSVVVSNANWLRTLINFVTKWYGFAILIIAPLLVILGLEIRNIYKIKLAEKQKQEDLKIKQAVDDAISKINPTNPTDNDHTQ